MSYPIYKIHNRGGDNTHIVAVKFTRLNTGIPYYNKNLPHYVEGEAYNHFTGHNDITVWQDPKSYEEWFLFLPEPYRAQALENLKKFPLSKQNFQPGRIISPERAIFYGFDWALTAQGYNYWREFTDGLRKETKGNFINVPYSAENAKIILDLSVTLNVPYFGNARSSGSIAIKDGQVVVVDTLENPVSVGTFVDELIKLKKTKKILGTVNGHEVSVENGVLAIGCTKLTESEWKTFIEAYTSNTFTLGEHTVKVFPGAVEIEGRGQLSREELLKLTRIVKF